MSVRFSHSLRILCTPGIMSAFDLLIALFLIPGTNAQYGEWSVGTQTLPRADWGMAVGALDRTIHVLGGIENPNQHVTLNISNSGQITSSHDLGQYFSQFSYPFNGYGQFYSQISSLLFMIPDEGKGIFVFNMLTQTFEYSATIPQSVYYGACLAAIDAQNAPKIIITGGEPEAFVSAINLTQIYDVTRGTWLQNNEPQNLQQARGGHSCVIHSNILYVIGGLDTSSTSLSSIEQATVNNTAEAFSMDPFEHTMDLSYGLYGARAVVVYDNILVIGGSNGTNNMQNIQVINTIDRTVTTGGELNYPVSLPGVVSLDNVLYAIGGGVDPISATYQYLQMLSYIAVMFTQTVLIF